MIAMSTAPISQRSWLKIPHRPFFFFFFFFFFFQALFSLQLMTTKIAFIFTSMNIPDISVHFSRFTVL